LKRSECDCAARREHSQTVNGYQATACFDATMDALQQFGPSIGGELSEAALGRKVGDVVKR
jgi:hypothetical protein